MDIRLKQQMDFILEVDKTKNIFRQTYLSDGNRKENDAEHAWHLAIMAYFLKEYSNKEIDISKVMIMVLIHDLVEIDAGDTYAYDSKGNESKRERELKAADRIFNILPRDQAKMIYDLWEEFEANETPEANFANTLDHIQPVMLNSASGGRSWREHGVSETQILQRNANTSLGSYKLWEYFKSIISENVEKGNIKK